jgi:hypothetical protein
MTISNLYLYSYAQSLCLIDADNLQEIKQCVDLNNLMCSIVSCSMSDKYRIYKIQIQFESHNTQRPIFSICLLISLLPYPVIISETP